MPEQQSDQETLDLDRHLCMHWSDDENRFLGAVVPPIYQNALFAFPSFDAFIQAHSNEKEHYVYWRGTNPTVEIVEKKLAALEGGSSCKCFASGIAAIAAAVFSSVSSGNHVVIVSHVYEETKKLLKYACKFGVSYTIASSTQLADIESAIRPETKLIVLESPTSFTFRLVDLRAVGELARARGIRTLVDNTWATPLYQKPLQLGIDMVAHSASKYLSGHSDLVGGAVIGSEADMTPLFYNEYLLLGASMAPMEASMLFRGLRTLPLRMEAHRQNALEVARFLEAHPAVARVNYPALPSHPDYELGRQQMSGCSGLMSFELREATFEAVRAVIDRLRVFQIGMSWGSFESLVLSPNYGKNEDQLFREGISLGLIRISVGMEATSLLKDDLDQALQRGHV